MFSFDALNDQNRTFVIAEAGSNWKCGSFNDDVDRGETTHNYCSQIWC